MSKKSLKRFLPIIIILILMAAIYLLLTFDIVDLEMIRKNHLVIKRFVKNYPILSPIIFIFSYIIIVALSIPIGSFVTMFAGYLFSPISATIYVILGATIGASIIFLAARYALSSFFRKKVGRFVEKLQRNFQSDSINYLLFLRFVPIFPFWALNISLAFLDVSLFNYAWTCLVGIIPGTFVYASAGSGLAEVLAAGEKVNIATIFNWKLRVTLIGIGIVILIPVIYKKFRKKKNTPDK
jgi:uncharacterized membrane protein YdjX (TVP38/TMEM64 family)